MEDYIRRPFASQASSGGFALLLCLAIPECFNWHSPFTVPACLFAAFFVAGLVCMNSNEDEDLMNLLMFFVSTVLSLGLATIRAVGGPRKFIAMLDGKFSTISAAALVLTALTLLFIAGVSARISMEYGVNLFTMRLSAFAVVAALSMIGFFSWFPTIIFGSLPVYLYGVSILSPSWLVRCPEKEGE